MATLVLTAVGSLFGPIGQLVGSLAGNAIDNQLFGPDDREGPRLKELAVTGSSYGTPIARHYGTMRVPGTIIWSTDLQEHRDKQSNGKGQPKTVTYSYSVNFAVALSSRPIDRVGRIWADGNLLRGANEDLKSAGTLRVYQGRMDQPRDPLMEAALGAKCPAFRGCAYAVFEDLDLTDFGNRIPALSFEIIAGDGSRLVEDLLVDSDAAVREGTQFTQLTGFSHEGGSLRSVIGTVDRLHPLASDIGGSGLVLSGETGVAAVPSPLPDAATWDEGEFGKQSGLSRMRSADDRRTFSALRYYDPGRDFQPGMQHADGDNREVRTYQFPGALYASDARDLVSRARSRGVALADNIFWRTGQLDPALVPGCLVTVPEMAGVWKVVGWEWRENGVELELVRHRITASSGSIADPGSGWSPPDQIIGATSLQVFEPPWDDRGSASQRHVYAAATSAGALWPGAAFYAVRDGSLVETGQTLNQRAIIAALAEPLPPSSALRFEAGASMLVDTIDPEANLSCTDMAGLAAGENRLLVGGEVIQFASAIPLGNGRWRLASLLRGRGATEIEAQQGHASGTFAVLLDNRLLELGEETLAAGTDSFAVIGLGDSAAVTVDLGNPGASLRPPCPVHPSARHGEDGAVHLSWMRRARGQWGWPAEVDLPLVEQSEGYLVGFGTVELPLAQWIAHAPSLVIAAGEAEPMLQANPDLEFWVRQQGSFAVSHPLMLGRPDRFFASGDSR